MLTSRTSFLPAGVPLLVAAGIAWGTGGLLGEALARVTGLEPVAVAACRLGAGGILLCGYLLGTGRRMPRGRAARRRVLAVGGLAALFQGAYFGAVAATSVGVATLVTIGSAPALVLAVESVRRRHLDRRPAVAVALSIGGLALLVGSGGAPVGLGALLALVAGAGFAAMTMLSQHPVDGLDAPTTTGVGFVIGAAVLVPFALVVSGPAAFAFAPGPAAVGLLAALAVLPTALAYTAFFAGMRTAPAGVGALVAVLEPVTAALLAALLLGEHLAAAGWAGAVVLVAAVAVGTRS